MKLIFSHHGFEVQGDYTPGTPATRDHPGDDPEFHVISVQIEDHDELTKIAGEWYEERD